MRYDPHWGWEGPGGARFELTELLAQLKDEKRFPAAMVDLTNTDRYYDRNIVCSLPHGVTHVKMKGLAGHGTIPAGAYIDKFCSVVDEVVREDPKALVVVHCTHGFNRTGYLICAYMIRKLGLSAREAVERFAAARSPGIYKAAYIDMLYYMTGELDAPDVNIRYPAETATHDDETRADAVCHPDTGAVIPEKLAAQKKVFATVLKQCYRLSDVVVSPPTDEAYAPPEPAENSPPASSTDGYSPPAAAPRAHPYRRGGGETEYYNSRGDHRPDHGAPAPRQAGQGRRRWGGGPSGNDWRRRRPHQ